MPRFSYTGIAPDGTTVEGTTRAQTSSAARAVLLERDVVPVTVDEKRSGLNFELTKEKVKLNVLMNFSRQLSTFVRAGIPIVEAINIINEETSDRALRLILRDMTAALRQGERVSAALEQHANRLPPFYVEMLKAGEVTGALEDVLLQLSLYIERDLEARRKIKSALAYPSIIFVMSIGTVAVMAGFVLPRFKTFFESLNADLPLPTRMLVSLTDFLTAWWWLLLSGFGGLLLSLFAFGRTRAGKVAKDRLKLRIPLVGGIIRQVIIERSCRMLASLVRAGVPLPRSLELLADGSRNIIYERGIREVLAGMLEGKGLSGPMTETGLFPTAVIQMIRVGEDTGTLEQQLQAAAEYYDRELTYKIARLTTYFEPAMILFMGAVVGFVAIALISAMYGIFNQVNP